MDKSQKKSSIFSGERPLEKADKAKTQKIQDLERERTGLLETMEELKRENDAKAQKIEDLE